MARSHASAPSTRSHTPHCSSPRRTPASSRESPSPSTAAPRPPVPTWSRSTGAGKLAARFERALHVPVGLALGDVAPLVPHFLAAGEGELDLGAAVLEVELGRHERQAALRDLARQRGELLLVQEQLAVAVRIVVREVSLLVHRDV